jgi:Mn2+/Fe2+ NRAMP family transporter
MTVLLVLVIVATVLGIGFALNCTDSIPLKMAGVITAAIFFIWLFVVSLPDIEDLS